MCHEQWSESAFRFAFSSSAWIRMDAKTLRYDHTYLYKTYACIDMLADLSGPAEQWSEKICPVRPVNGLSFLPLFACTTPQQQSPLAWHVIHHAAGCTRHRCGDGGRIRARCCCCTGLRGCSCRRFHFWSAAPIERCFSVLQCETMLM